MIDILISIIIQLVVSAIIVEAITEIIVDSKIFEPARNGLYKLVFKYEPIGKFRYIFIIFQSILAWVYGLITCGYCTSVWIAMLAAIAWPHEYSKNIIIDFIGSTFIIHRLSNLYHVLYQLILRGRVITQDINLTVSTTTLDSDNSRK